MDNFCGQRDAIPRPPTARRRRPAPVAGLAEQAREPARVDGTGSSTRQTDDGRAAHGGRRFRPRERVAADSPLIPNDPVAEVRPGTVPPPYAGRRRQPRPPCPAVPSRSGPRPLVTPPRRTPTRSAAPGRLRCARLLGGRPRAVRRLIVGRHARPGPRRDPQDARRGGAVGPWHRLEARDQHHWRCPAARRDSGSVRPWDRAPTASATGVASRTQPGSRTGSQRRTRPGGRVSGWRPGRRSGPVGASGRQSRSVPYSGRRDSSAVATATCASPSPCRRDSCVRPHPARRPRARPRTPGRAGALGRRGRPGFRWGRPLVAFLWVGRPVPVG